MRPVAYIVVHPSKLSVVESILYTKALRPAVEISVMQNLLTSLNQRGLFGAEFAECMAALWTGINGSPSWRMRSVLDAHEGLEACIAGYHAQLRESSIKKENLLCMATPRTVETLVANGYDLVFFESDTSYMGNAEALVSFPKHLEGVCGEWLKFPKLKRELLGTVIEGISIPA